ncbi:unnamed protein product [Ectocarpus sp. 12 AP-2014]
MVALRFWRLFVFFGPQRSLVLFQLWFLFRKSRMERLQVRVALPVLCVQVPPHLGHLLCLPVTFRFSRTTTLPTNATVVVAGNKQRNAGSIVIDSILFLKRVLAPPLPPPAACLSRHLLSIPPSRATQPPPPGGRFRYIIDIVVAVHGVPFSRTTGTCGGREAEETASGEGHQIAGALLLPLAPAHQLGADLHQLDGGAIGLLDDNLRERRAGNQRLR